MRRLAVLLSLVVIAGCSSDPKPESASTPTYKLPPRPARDGETPLPYRQITDGKMIFTPIGFRAKMSYVVGSHADWPAKGQFVRVRVITENGYATFHTLDLGKQVLVTTDGATHTPDENAMRIERQPASVEIGSHDRVEFDLIFDIAKTAKEKALRLFGDPTDDLGVPATNDAGVETPLP